MELTEGIFKSGCEISHCVLGTLKMKKLIKNTLCQNCHNGRSSILALQTKICGFSEEKIPNLACKIRRSLLFLSIIRNW